MGPWALAVRANAGYACAMRAALLVLCVWAARAGAVELGISEIAPQRDTPDAEVPAKAREALDAFWPARGASMKAWPGYEPLARPLLLAFSDGTALLIDHPSPPPPFRPVVRRGLTVFVADRGPDLDRDFRFNYEFAGAPVTAVREARDAPPRQMVLLTVHEMFHQFQDGFRDETPYREYEVEDGEDVALAALENRALASWLERPGPEPLRDFAALRARRRARMPGTAAEIGEENLEGTAEFVEAAAQAAIDGEGKARAALAAKLRKPLAAKEMSKGRLYPVGAALGLVLEARSPGAWQAGVEAGRSLSMAALEGARLSGADAARRADRLTSGPDYARLLAAASRSVEERKRRREKSRLAYEAQDGPRVELHEQPVRGGFWDDGDWFVDEEGRRLHTHVIEWVGDGDAGRFRLRDMPVLEWRKANGRFLEFHAPGADIRVDGAAWNSAFGWKRFHFLSIRGRGVDASFYGGTVEPRDGGLAVYPGDSGP